MKKDKSKIKILGFKMSSNNFVALVLCVIIGAFMLYRTVYVNKKLSQNTETVIAEVIDIYSANHGRRLWGYEMKYKYFLHDREYVNYEAIQKNEIDKINVGDCIEVIVSLDDNKVQKWNKSKGTFKCQYPRTDRIGARRQGYGNLQRQVGGERVVI
jgi:hypothetical protein